METVLVNLGGKVKRVQWDGRSWLVAPVSSITPGVLNGSQGPLLYEEAEVGQYPNAWDGMPLVLRHPVVNGQHVSARRPDVIESQGLGWVFNSTFAGKLQHEAWFDEEKTRRHDANLPPEHRIIPRLKGGTPIEVSTGLFTTNLPSEGVFNGKAYTHIARGLRADHLAVLPDQVGACSVKDGCGVLVNEGDPDERFVRRLERFLTLVENAKGKSGGRWVTMHGTHLFIKGGQVTKGPKKLKKELNKPEKGKSDAERFQETGKRTDRRAAHEQAKAEGFRGAKDKARFEDANARHEGFKDAADKARFEAAGKRQDRKEGRDDKAATRQNAKRLMEYMREKQAARAKAEPPGRSPQGAEAVPAKPKKKSLWQRVKGFFTRNALPSATADVTPAKACAILHDKQVNGHPLSPKQRRMFGAICGKRDAPAHNAAYGEPGWECAVCNTDHEPAATPVPEPVRPAIEPATNAESHEDGAMKLTPEQKAEIVSALTANCDCQGMPWSGLDAAALNAKADEALYTMAECMKAMKKEKPAMNATAAATPAVTPPAAPAVTATPAPVVNAAPVAAPVAPPVLTAEQFAATLFPGMSLADIRGAVTNALKVEAQAREHVAGQLRAVAAVEPNPQRKALIEGVLAGNASLDELNRTLVLVGAPFQAQPSYAPNYAGAAAPAANAADDGDNLLPEITYNFDDYAPEKAEKARKKA